MRKRTLLDWIVLAIVVIIAGIVIALSFHNTTKIADVLGMNPYLTAGIVEILFGALLFIRGKQRATQRNVPMFMEIGYFISLAAVTAVNMYGLAQENAVIGTIVGLAISGAMWLMENTLVWLWTKSHEPYRKTVKQLMKDAKRDISEEQVIQQIEWMKWEARNPNLKLIKRARRAEERRRDVIGDGLPEYFNQPLPKPEVHELIAATVQETQEQETNHQAEVVPIKKRQIGFYSPDGEPLKSPALFQANVDEQSKAIETAKELANELGRKPKKKELLQKGLTDHYARLALKEIEN